MASSAFSRIPIELVEIWALYLEDEDLRSFRLVCKQADAQTFNTVAQRFFTTWRTSLMGRDLEVLERISRERLAKCVKSLHVMDDYARKHSKEFLLGTQDGQETERLSYVWPRNEVSLVQTDQIGIANLRNMLVEKRLVLETLTIDDHRSNNRNTTTTPIFELAKDLLSDSKLTIISLSIYNTSLSSTQAEFQFDPERQGEDTGFSMLRNAECRLGPHISSYLSDNILYHSPRLADLLLSFDRAPGSQKGWITAEPCFQLDRFRLATSSVPAALIFAMLSSSKNSLTGLSFTTITLDKSSNYTWRTLLTEIGDEFPNLNCFELRALSKEGSGPTNFHGFSKNKLDECSREGLEIVPRGPSSNPRISWIKYEGSDASNVLKTVALYAPR